MNIRALVVALALLIPAVEALAADHVVRWTNATRTVEGTTIPATGPEALASTRIQVGTCNGTAFGTLLQEQTVSPSVTSATFSGLVAGSNVCARGFHRNNAGQESAVSNVAVSTVPTSPPQPPVLQTTANVAIAIKGKGKNAEIRLVGYVPIGTPCSGKPVTVSNVTYHEIPESAISWFSYRGGSTFYGLCDVTA